MRFTFPLIGLGLLSTSMVLSAEEFESHGAHVHGIAQLQIVAEKNTLEIHLESPAMNIIGFEHDVENEQQAEKFKKSLSTLMKSDELFLLSGGQCSFIEIEIENPFEEEHDHHEDHDQEKGHDHHEKQDHGEDHDHDEEHKHHQGESEHREFEVEYKAICQDISKLSRIDLPLLTIFDGIESLNVQYVVRGNQGAVNITKANASLDLPK